MDAAMSGAGRQIDVLTGHGVAFGHISLNRIKTTVVNIEPRTAHTNN